MVNTQEGQRDTETKREAKTERENDHGRWVWGEGAAEGWRKRGMSSRTEGYKEKSVYSEGKGLSSRCRQVQAKEQ